jgi:hypothetical protein
MNHNKLTVPDLVNLVFIIPDTNKIFINYSLFKACAQPSNYVELIQLFHEKIKELKVHYQMYEIHVNLTKFTPKAIAKYYSFTQLLYEMNVCDMNEVTCLVVYNVSLLMNNISHLFVKYVGVEYKNKLILHEKEPSVPLLNQLFAKKFLSIT